MCARSATRSVPGARGEFTTFETLESRRFLSGIAWSLAVTPPVVTPAVAHAARARIAPPGAPMQLRAVADPSVATIRLYWTDNSSKETGFTVQRKKGRSGAWATVATLPANATYYRSAHLANGSAYAFRACAFNRGGSSPWSAPASATTVTPQPPPPPPPPPPPGPQPPDLPPVTTKVMPPVHQTYSPSDLPAGEPFTDASGGRDAIWVNVSADPLFAPGGPTADGAIQGATGDCYFISALSELARRSPSLITQMVHENDNGTYDVSFYRNGARQDVTVDGYLPANNGQDLLFADFGRDGSVWAAIIEKAFTYFRDPASPASYSRIDTGDELGTLPYFGFSWPGTLSVYDDAATNAGSPFNHVHNAQELYNGMNTQLAQGHAVTYSTLGANVLTGPLVPAHVYGVYSVSTDPAGNEYVILRNPWGTTGPHVDGYSVETIQTLYSQFFRVDAASV